MTPQLQDRLRASGAHLLSSICLAAVSAAVVFWLWYPAPLAEASGVRDIFVLLLLVDISLGPLITLFVFNKKKPELKRDLIIVAVIQLAALLYGLHAVFIARPAFIVMASDRFDLVFANDLDDNKLSEAKLPQFTRLPVLGPEYAGAPMPDDAKERSDLTLSSVAGGDDLQHVPKYYQPYAAVKTSVIQLARPLDKLRAFNKTRGVVIDQLQVKHQASNPGFLPMRGKVKDLTVIVNRTTGDVLEVVELQHWP